MDDEKLKDKISEDEKRTILSKRDETVKWLDSNQLAEWTSSRTSRRRWRQSAAPSSPSCTSKVEHLMVACLMGCPIKKPTLVPAVQDPRLKKLTKLDLLKT